LPNGFRAAPAHPAGVYGLRLLYAVEGGDFRDDFRGIAAHNTLSIVLDEKGLTDRLVNSL